jgi:hypothetical protein
MKRYLEPGEIVIYRLKKTKFPIVFMIIFFSIWIYFSVIFFRIFWGVAVNGVVADKNAEYLIGGLIGPLIFLPVVLIIVLTYFLNQLVITDRRVYIRRGLFGSTRIVNLCDIRAFQHAFSRTSKSSNHKIWFYLGCGEIVKTGELFATLGSLQELLEVLRQKFEGRGFTAEERRQMKQQSGGVGQPIRKTNGIAVFIALLPLILSAIYVARYLTL